MTKIRDLLLERRREVQAGIAPLKAELKQIDVALAAINGENRNARRGRSGQSIGDQTLDILKDHPAGLPTRTMVREIRHRFGREISRRNMSWHFSRLKSDGRVTRVGENWKLPTDRNEAPDVLSGASSTTDNGNGNPSSNESRESAAP